MKFTYCLLPTEIPAVGMTVTSVAVSRKLSITWREEFSSWWFVSLRTGELA
jgi:hypothetical protein